MTQRRTYEAVLIESGRPVLPLYGCRCCSAQGPAFAFAETVPDDGLDHPFACAECILSAIRKSEAEKAQRVAAEMEAAGVLSEEFLNGLRALRDQALTRTDWTQLADNRDRLGSEVSATWDAHRAAWRDWFVTARDTGVVGDFPVAPE